MPQSFSAVYILLIFSTKGRRPFLSDRALRERSHAELGGISKRLECAPLLTGGVEDHVHQLARFGRTLSIADWVKELKSASNLWLKEQSDVFAGFEWQAGYAAFSVSASNLDQVMKYIANQEEHHRRMTFQDDLRELLKRHGMEWDERYVWD
jgi:putative transposase